MEKGQLIKYSLIIIVVLATVFLSQQAFTQGFSKTFISAVGNQVGKYTAKGSEWVTSKIYPKINGESQNGGAAIQNSIDQTKKIPENILKNVENYFSGIGNSILHPGDSQTCATPSK